MYQAINLREMAEAWRCHLDSEGKSPRTIRVYLQRLGEFIEWYEEDGDELGTKVLRRFVSFLRSRPKQPGNGWKTAPEGGLSPDAVRLYTVALKSFFRFLFEDGELEENPAARLPIPKVPDKLPRYVSRENLQRWFEPLIDSRSATDIRLYAMSILMLDSGLRVGELCRIRIEDVDLANHRVKVMGKGSRERFVPVQRKAAEAVLRYIYAVRDMHPTVTTDRLFINQSGTALTTGGVQRTFRAHSERTSVKVTPHMLRHTFATYGLRNGYNLFELQKALGHAHLELTQRYATVTFEDVAKRHETASPANSLAI